MAETTVKLVLGKIADILLKEALFLGGVRDKMEFIKRELARIQCFLRDAESKRKQDKQAKHWVNEVRDVAYQIEDAIDEYFVETNYSCRKDSTFLCSITLFKLPLCAVHSLGSKIVKIQEVLREISESKDRYEVCLDQGKEQELKRHMRPRYELEDLDETEVVGFQAEKNAILSTLLDAKLSRRTIIAIMGCGGVGKATLAQMAYKRQVQPFFS